VITRGNHRRWRVFRERIDEIVARSAGSTGTTPTTPAATPLAGGDR